MQRTNILGDSHFMFLIHDGCAVLNDFPGKSDRIGSMTPFVADFPEYRGSNSISLDFSFFETCPMPKTCKTKLCLGKGSKNIRCACTSRRGVMGKSVFSDCPLQGMGKGHSSPQQRFSWAANFNFSFASGSTDRSQASATFRVTETFPRTL